MEQEKKAKRHGDLLPSSIRAVFCSPSNCGKTNSLLTLIIHHNGVRFENVYTYSKSLCCIVRPEARRKPTINKVIFFSTLNVSSLIELSHYPTTTRNIGPSSRIVAVQQRHGHAEETSFYLLRLLSSSVEIASPSS